MRCSTTRHGGKSGARAWNVLQRQSTLTGDEMGLSGASADDENAGTHATDVALLPLWPRRCWKGGAAVGC